MSGIPLNIPIPTENVLANYDWTDMMEGTGTIDFNVCSAVVAGSSVNILHRSTLDNGRARSNIKTAQTFSLSRFNVPATLVGESYFSFSYFVDIASGGQQVKVKVDVNKNGTSIASTTSELQTGDLAFTTLLNVTLPKTHFAIGDILSVTFSLDSDPGVTAVYLHIDPENLNYVGTYTMTATTNHTDAHAYIPFKIDL